MNIAELQKNVRVYGKDKSGNEVLIPLSHYSVGTLLEKNLVHRIEIDSNDIRIYHLLDPARLEINIHNSFRYNKRFSIEVFPEVVYGENVDCPGSFGGDDIFIIKSVIFKTSKNLSLSYFFSGLSSLVKIQHFVAKNIVNTSKMFAYCHNLKKIPKLDTSKVTDMSEMFSDCRSLLNAPALDTSMVRNMDRMFYRCVQLENFPNYKTDKVLSAEQMFVSCDSLSGKIKISNLSSCKNIEGMFAGCENIEEIELTQTDNITNYSALCSRCTALKKFSVSSTRCGEKFSDMFSDCSSLEKVSVFDFTSALNCEFMFRNCEKLPSFISKNSNKLQDISFMFENCISLREFDIGNYQNIKIQHDAFKNCLNILVNEIHVYELPEETIYQKINVIIDKYGYIRLPEFLKNINLKNYDLECCDLEKILSHHNLKYVQLPMDIVFAIEHTGYRSTTYGVIEGKYTYWEGGGNNLCYDKLLYIDPICIKRGEFTYTVHDIDSDGYEIRRRTNTKNYFEPTFCNVFKYFKKSDRVRNRVYDDFNKSHGVVVYQEGNLFFESAKKNLREKVDFYVNEVLTLERNPDKLYSLLVSKKITKIVIKDNFVMLDILFGTDEIKELPSIEISKGVVSCRGLFSDLRKLKTIKSLSFLSDELEDLTAMFLNCESLVFIPPLKFSKVTVLDYIFSGCISLKKSPSIVWTKKSSEFISMCRMFENCKNLKSVYGIDLNGRMISNIKGIFYHCFSISSFMSLDIVNDLPGYDIFFDKNDNSKISEMKKTGKEIKNNLIKKMLNDNQFVGQGVYNKYATEHEPAFSSIDDLAPNENRNLGFVKGIIDGTNPKYGIFVNIPSKEKTGLIHISRLSKSQINNLSHFQKGDKIVVKIIREKKDNKLELDFFD